MSEFQPQLWYESRGGKGIITLKKVFFSTAVPGLILIITLLSYNFIFINPKKGSRIIPIDVGIEFLKEVLLKLLPKENREFNPGYKLEFQEINFAVRTSVEENNFHKNLKRKSPPLHF